MPLTVRAPAKINLYLRVFPVGHDGFHPLRSWFRAIDLADDLHMDIFPGFEDLDPLDHVELIEETREAGPFVDFACSDASLPTGEQNLVVRAARAYFAPQTLPVAIYLQKRIPVGAGLGGGSSDAAAVLAGMDQINNGALPYSEVARMAARVGADVPFFLRHQLDGITDATCTGRGDIVQPFTAGRRHAVLLILPELHGSTPAVYARFDELPAPPEDDSPDFAAWSHLPALELLPRLRNDLEAAAFSLHPELGRLREHMEKRLARPVRMTGSGSALFTLYDDRADAAAQATDQVEQFEQLAFRRTLA
jgi:4-diphosphocytidyl-2-C-methyl-D-erythritol kinase